jgi:hypothetical protein
LPGQGFFSKVEEQEKPEQIEKPVVSSEEMIQYRFGKTTKDIMKNLIDFITTCISDEGEVQVHPDTAAESLKLSKRAKEVFINQLSSIRLGTKPLITKNKYGEYFSNYPAKQIIDYVSEIKND